MSELQNKENSPPKIIFLDIDGVLNNEKSMDLYRTCEILWPDNIAQLNKILKATGAKIVISSFWRYTEKFPDCLIYSGVWNAKSLVVGLTPEFSNTERVFEIESWIQRNNYTGLFCILDDYHDMHHLNEHLFKINPDTGLTSIDADAIIKYLNKE